MRMKIRNLRGRLRAGQTRASARAVIVAIVIAILPAVSRVQAGETYCNPLDIDYKYNFEGRRAGISYRSGADPVIINHDGKYYLFGTIAYGFWRSDNLRDWEHVKPSGWPQA